MRRKTGALKRMDNILQQFIQKGSVPIDDLLHSDLLYLHHKSSGAYETLRKSGVIRLPSGRTLRDYRHFAPVCTGLSLATDRQLRDLTHKNSHLSKYVIIIVDEMYVKEGLVFNIN